MKQLEENKEIEFSYSMQDIGRMESHCSSFKTQTPAKSRFVMYKDGKKIALVDIGDALYSSSVVDDVKVYYLDERERTTLFDFIISENQNGLVSIKRVCEGDGERILPESLLSIVHDLEKEIRNQHRIVVISR